jgi:hypothetical protein
MLQNGHIDQATYDAEKALPLLTVQNGDYEAFRESLPPRGKGTARAGARALVRHPSINSNPFATPATARVGRVACVGQAAGKRRCARSATLPHAIRVLRSGRKIDRFFTRASGTRDEIPVARGKQRETRHFAHEEKLLHRRMIVLSTSCG